MRERERERETQISALYLFNNMVGFKNVNSLFYTTIPHL